jgi:glycerol uptake facilitator-like aquaporin
MSTINDVLGPIIEHSTYFSFTIPPLKKPLKTLFMGFIMCPHFKYWPRSAESSDTFRTGWEIEMNEKGMIAELIGSMTITLLVFGDWAGTETHGTAAAAGLAGVTLGIMWMTFKGSQILPIITIGRMAAGEDDWETGATNFAMQILGALIGAAVLFWGMEVETLTTGAASDVDLTLATIATALIGGFLLMSVWTRLGAGWESAAFAAVLVLAGMELATASNLGSMIVTSSWSDTNMVTVFGTMIIGGIGAAAALMAGDQIFEEE